MAEGHRWSSSEDLHSDERSSSTELSVTNTGSEHDSSDTPDNTLSDAASSIDLDSFLGPEFHKPPSFTFKIVGDNIDKTVKPRDMRSDYQAQSLHYFHSYAVRDRVSMDGFDDTASSPDIGAVRLELLLPTLQDEANIRKNMSIVV